MDAKHFMKDHASQNVPLNYEEAYTLGKAVINGCNGDRLDQIQSLAILTALHNRATYSFRKSRQVNHEHNHALPENAAEQIAGLCAAVFFEDIATSKFGYLNPEVPYAIDNCGMGGDLITTANVSTIAALIASIAGIPICKHGSPANADKGQHGSSDFIQLLNINAFGSKQEVEACVRDHRFGYTEALDTRYKQIHLQTHEFAFMPHMNDIIGPITNPLNPRLLTRRVLGVNHLISPVIVAKAYQIMNEREVTFLEHGIFVRGFASRDRLHGFDELSICEGGSHVVEMKADDKKLQCEYIHARHFELEPIPIESVSPPSGMGKGEFSLQIIRGEKDGPVLSMILANAALIFRLNNPERSYLSCYHDARSAFSPSNIRNKIQDIRNYLPS